MRYFIISDAHSNLEGTLAVINDMRCRFNPCFFDPSIKGKENGDLFVNLGDSIGYGANPNEVMNVLWKFANIGRMGNHDEAVYRLIRREAIKHASNPTARQALGWTARNLNEKNRDRIAKLVENKR